MLNFLSGEIAKAQDVLKAGMVLLGIFFIGFQWIKHKALVPVLGAVLLMGVTSFATFNTGWFTKAISQETNNSVSSIIKPTP